MNSVAVEEIRVIELNMMDKRKYFPLTLVSGFMIRGLLYPFSVIRTRLQIQKGTTVYKGTYDAFMKIRKFEGTTGLYRGFWVSTLHMAPSFAYITTYESVRHYMVQNTTCSDSKIRSLMAGGSASIVGQTLSVPVDIVSQHMMLLGQRVSSPPVKVERKMELLHRLIIPDKLRKKRFGAVFAIVKEIYRLDGLFGFYKGYFVSLAVFAPNSALWWFFYDAYSGILTGVSPDWFPRLALQLIAAPFSGVTAALITNPLDVIRARIQVEGAGIKETTRLLWQQERYRILLKGLSARLIQSVTFSFCLMLGYESIKRWSLLDEYKSAVRW